MKEAWKKHFAPVIWQRGQKRYEDGAVTNLRQDGNTIPSLYKPEGKAFEKYPFRAVDHGVFQLRNIHSDFEKLKNIHFRLEKYMFSGSKM